MILPIGNIINFCMISPTSKKNKLTNEITPQQCKRNPAPSLLHHKPPAKIHHRPKPPTPNSTAAAMYGRSPHPPFEFEVYYEHTSNSRPITYELAIDLDKNSRPFVSKERLRQRRKGQRHGWPYSLEKACSSGFYHYPSTLFC
ncbi:MAG: hypothetical protein PF689_07635 [Deltaproteobacteria bacterium]|jgi:hypothetical protein|nr:hypothetical protein [Deltaproteobacteria bacterium]